MFSAHVAKQLIPFTAAISLLSFGSAQLSQAATVVGTSKKKPLVKIDEGSDTGFVKGAKACLPVEGEEKPICGVVLKSTETTAFVKVPDGSQEQFKKGVVLSLQGAKMRGKSAKKARTVTSLPYLNNFELAWLVTVLGPMSYNQIVYNAPETSSESDLSSLWKTDTTKSMSLFGVQAKIEFAVSQTQAIAFGLRYRTYGTYMVDSDYNLEQASQYVSSEQSASALGLFFDYSLFNLALGPSFGWRNAVGLDYDMSSVTFKATQKTDGSSDATEIASAKSSLSVISLRLGTGLTWLIFEPVGVNFGLNLLVPIVAMGSSFSATVNDPQVSQLSDPDGAKDLEKAMGHTKNSFGAELIISTLVAF